MFVANDAMALGVLQALHECGRRVPEDVSVVGFDDVPEAAYFWPALTTVQPGVRRRSDDGPSVSPLRALGGRRDAPVAP